MSFIRNVMNVFVSPEKTFDHVDEKPMIWLPMLVIIVVASAVTMLGFSALVENQQQVLIDAYVAQGQPVPSDGMVGLAKGSAYAAVAMVGVVFVITVLIKTLFSRGIATFMSGEGTFKRLFSALLFAYFIMLLGVVISSVLVYAFKLDGLTFSPAMFFEGLKGTPTYAVLSALDVFTIWYLWVSAIAIQKIEKIGMPKAIACAVIPFLVMLGINVITMTLTA